MIFETLNELTLKVTFEQGERIHTKVGAMIGFQGNLKFDKELLGPGSNVVGQAVGQLVRRFTGENLPLMKTSAHSQSIGYFADNAQHVVVINLNAGERIGVESENILAFTESCKYGVMFLPTGVIGGKGLATSTIEGPGQVAITVDGNPIVLKGQSVVDPDAMIAFTGLQPTVGLDLSWKNLIGQASGESYNLKFNDPNNVVIIQPKERQAGLDISMDGKRTGSKPQMQNNPTVGQAMNQVGNTMQSAGNMMNQAGNTMNNMGNQNPMGGQGQGGIGDILGNLFR